MNIELIVIVLAGIFSTYVAVSAKVQGDKKEKEYQEKIDNLKNSLVEETGLLSTLLLMDKYVVSKIRVVFTFENPINKLDRTEGTKFKPKKLEPSASLPPFKWATSEGIGNIFTSGEKSQFQYFLSFKADLGDIGNFKSSVDIVKPVITNFVYLENNKQHLAIEFVSQEINLAQLYSQIQKNENSVTIRKNYSITVLKENIEKIEKNFIDQKITVSIEVPVIEEKGIWFKVNLSPVNNQFAINSDIGVGHGKYYYSEYKLEVTKLHKGFIYNKINE